RQRAVRRGRDMLDMLDEIRRGLLEGAVSASTLKRLAGLANTKREDFVDPGLSQVLDDIDLRARVELAKLQYAGAR
ncbi:MAG: flagellar assembly protein FliX, partial [Alphaproteobacteria bacterium]